MFFRDRLWNFMFLLVVILSGMRTGEAQTLATAESTNGANTTSVQPTTTQVPTTTPEPIKNCSVHLDNSTACDLDADPPLLCFYYNETSNMTYCEFYFILFPPTTTVPFVWTDISTKWVTPLFIGRKTTTRATTLPPTTRVTHSPYTIPCPRCSLVDENVVCEADPVRCDQYEGCWYYTNSAGVQTKGCKDIIPEETGIIPDKCTSFYKTRYCLKGHCLSCDLKGLGGAERPSFNTLLTLSACLLAFLSYIFH